MRFFFDNNLSPLLAEALDLLDEDHQVVPLRKKFHPSTRDIDWLTALGAETGLFSLGIRELRDCLRKEKFGCIPGCLLFFSKPAGPT